MKFAKHLLAATIAAVSFGAAQAESDITTGTGAISANAKLNFRVSIPKVLFLSVGTGTLLADNTNVDEVQFALTAAGVGTAGSINGTVAPAGGGTSTSSAAIRLISTAPGNVTLSAAGSAGGLTGPGAAIPWTAITGTGTGIAHPTIGGTGTTITPTGGVVNATGSWTFAYAHTGFMTAGDYTGQVTYTASAP
jgi:hypothetical protein